MYSSYSTLQRKQLTKQVYTDTQSTYLLVYAPGRHQALEHALENQLHRKFRLVTELAPALTDSVEGVLLVSEDLECTSTALTYFAAALRTGADFVVCDAAFGSVSYTHLDVYKRQRITEKKFFSLSITPLLRPVVPEVNIRTIRASWSMQRVSCAGS